MHAAPSISVIIPVFEVAAFVEPCLASLADQEWQDFEALVVDDGSTDGSGDLAEAFAAKDSRFRVIRQQNAGLSAARNVALDQARGEWIAFIDGDDRVAPTWLSELLAAAKSAEAPWAFCGIRCLPLPGEVPGPPKGWTHSTVHDAPDLPPTPVFALEDWREIVRLFPSAWNKIYHRDLIGETRFEEGIWYEDHAFYWSLAAKSDRIGRTASYLYWQTRERAGQITGTVSPKIMDQVHVLRQFPQIAKGSGKPGGREAYGRLIARLMHERAELVGAPSLRARFAKAGQALVAEAGVTPDPGEESRISRAFLRRMEGSWPLSVIIPIDAQAPPFALRETLEAIWAQGFQDYEIIIAHDGQPSELTRGLVRTWERRLPRLRQTRARWRGISAARNAGLLVAQGDLVVFLDAGDRPGPPAFGGWVEGLLREKVPFGFSSFHVGDPTHRDAYSFHSGLHDPAPFGGHAPDGGAVDLSPEQAMVLHAHPSAKIFDRSFLRSRELLFPAGRFSAWEMTLRVACVAGKAVYQPNPGLLVDDRPPGRRVWRTPVSPRAIALALDRLEDLGGILPEHWRRRLFARAAWEVSTSAGFAEEAERDAFREAAAAWPETVAWREQGDVPLDPYLDDWAKWLVTGIPGAEPADCSPPEKAP